MDRFCALVYDHYFAPSAELTTWYAQCRSESRKHKFSSRAEILETARNLVSSFHVSHLGIYDASETEEIWTSGTNSTGIHSLFVDEELLIFSVQPGSPGAKAQLQRGDRILSINKDEPTTFAAERTGGEFEIERAGQVINVRIKLAKFIKDQTLKIKNLNSVTRWLQVESFRKEFFEWPTLENLFAGQAEGLEWIIDLRGNAGGNFVAGLRLLSFFVCTPDKGIGLLERPRQTDLAEDVLVDDLDDGLQITQLEESSRLILQTSKPPVCLAPKSLVVLVDRETASTAELFSQAAFEQLNATVLGEPTAGELLVSVWYPLPEWGEGVTLSIPEAIFVSALGHQVEGLGASLSETLYWSKDSLKAGRDEWLEKAMRF